LTALVIAFSHCRLHLTSHKVPRVLEFYSEALPKSGIGKVLRRALRDEDQAARERPGSGAIAQKALE